MRLGGRRQTQWGEINRNRETVLTRLNRLGSCWVCQELGMAIPAHVVVLVVVCGGHGLSNQGDKYQC